MYTKLLTSLIILLSFLAIALIFRSRRIRYFILFNLVLSIVIWNYLLVMLEKENDPGGKFAISFWSLLAVLAHLAITVIVSTVFYLINRRRRSQSTLPE
jgi:predicted permease